MEHEWKSEAEARFPEYLNSLQQSDSPYDAWITLCIEFGRCYESAPRNVDLISRIIDFSEWCVSRESNTDSGYDLPTCVCVSFYEHILEHEEAIVDLLRYFNSEEIMAMRDVFARPIGENRLKNLLGL